MSSTEQKLIKLNLLHYLSSEEDWATVRINM